MKALIQFIFPTVKAVASVTAFFIGIGWAAFATISVMVKAEADVVRQEVKHIRDIDVAHINKRFDSIDSKLGKIESLIMESR